VSAVQERTGRRVAQLVFAVLVLATLGAFFVAQRLKQSPAAVVTSLQTRAFSPNGDGRQERAAFTLRLRRADDVSIAVLNRETDERVRTLVTDRPIPAGRPVTFQWDGRTDEGRVAPDALYKILVSLRRQGRSSFVNKRVALDATPPNPVVTTAVPGGRPRGLAITPSRGSLGVNVRLDAPGLGAPVFEVLRTDGARPRRVARFAGGSGLRTARWDGLVDGRPAPAGTYRVTATTRDAAGNMGTTRPGKGGRFPGRPGVTVRYIAAQAPAEPVVAGALADVFVDARGGRYGWELRRLGHRRVIAAGLSRSPRLRLRAPRGPSGVYLVEVRTRDHSAAAALAVTRRTRGRVLVVLPALSWQGQNAADDDGDGRPDTLRRGGIARLDRPFAGGGLPPGFAGQEGPLLSWLERRELRYALTTDTALAAGRGPKLEGHKGVLLAGNPRWLPADLHAGLRRYVEGGGKVLSVGTESLRRFVDIRGTTMRNPSRLGADDLFGSRIGGLARRRLSLLSFPTDELKLFVGTGGLIRGFGEAEFTQGVGREGKLIGGAGPREDRPVIASYRLGKGIVMRTGLPAWSVHLGTDPAVASVMRRMWLVLSR